MEHYKRWAAHHQPTGRRVVVLALAGGLFVGLIPWALVAVAPTLDDRLGWSGFTLGPAGGAVALVLLAAGGVLAVWSVVIQVQLGRGTPVPIVPTQNLVATGPYAWSRNPMVLGTIAVYLGLGLLAGSASAVVLVVTFGAALLLYVRFVEERELEARFGPAYVAYKARVPFLLPRPWRRGAEGNKELGS